MRTIREARSTAGMFYPQGTKTSSVENKVSEYVQFTRLKPNARSSHVRGTFKSHVYDTHVLFV